MARKRLPRVGELVVATVRQVFDYGAYVTLDEYNDLEAYLPWSEVASRWVRNIRNVLRENQKIVVKVIRVNKKRGTVDVSLKKVLESEKRQKMLLYKRLKKGENLLKIVAEKTGMDYDKLYNMLEPLIQKEFGDLLGVFEDTALKGKEILVKAGIPEEIASAIEEVAKTHVKIKEAVLKGMAILQTFDPEGVDKIRRVLMNAYDFMKGDEIRVRIYTIGAPRYVIEVHAFDYKTAGKTLEAIGQKILEDAKKEGFHLYQFQQVKQS
ncbi:translation initiation factor IF-2 subunit alpha [Ignicoccus islandicus DSM 13165]|uniref:Translation initiation factor IF-2 subunit alpha n=1 Tax=Ignicoccus islandicus DSM 13165 TaxID=940295 RepID=A0A0U3E9F6_9CREN|nr:translation initiation factor IF-2 subunit alpha [Ignicoccus islandicus]ALU11950.1 translation initiation factor IF-2 subunit alpha [Ignicoccus islandicus DSM 13165]